MTIEQPARGGEAVVGKPTLEYALRPHAVDIDEVIRRHPAVTQAVRNIIGLVPRCDPYLEIWPPAFVTYNVLIPNLFDVPRCDLGRGISPDVRSLVAYVSSRSFGCAYCSAHTAVMGTIFKGPRGTLAKNEEAMNADTCPLFSSAERAAIDFAAAVGLIPSVITTEHRIALARHFGAVDEERVVLSAAMMGFLNRCMDSLGVVLEWDALQTAQERLAPTGWFPGAAYDEVYDAPLLAGDQAGEATLKESPGLLGHARMVAGCMAYDVAALKAIPRTHARLTRLLEAELGFVPYYIDRLQRTAPRRAFAHLLLQRLHSPGVESPTWVKHAMCFIAATRAENPILAAHAAYLADRAGLAPARLAATLDRDRLAAMFSSREAAALDFAHATASAPAAIGQAVVDGLVASYTPAGIVELVIVASALGPLQRYTATYPPSAYEEPVAAFVARHGAGLGLAASPATSEQARWDDLADAERARR